MSFLPRLSSLLRNWFRKERVERDLHDEVSSYLEQLTEEKVAAGMNPAAARRAARIELGGVEQVKEQVRAARTGAWLEQFAQDVRYGLRMLRKSPGFTAVAVLTLALGIGANTAIFSVVYAVLLRPMPFPESQRLVTLWQSDPQRGLTLWQMSQANFAAYREHNNSFESLAAYSRAGANLTGEGEPERVQVANVTQDFFEVLRVPPLIGRAFRPEEDAPGRNSVCILSFGLWQRRFGSDPKILGTKILLNGAPTEVVGVMPKAFEFPDALTRLWMPLGFDASRTSPFQLRGIARLKSGVPPEVAESATTATLRSIAQKDAAFAGSNAPAPADADLKTVVRPLLVSVTLFVRQPLLLILGAVALVLLIACANVANLQLARATARAQEISVRFALGATPMRIARQLLTESLLLSALGGVVGVLLARWGVESIVRLAGQDVPRLGDARVDGTVLAFTAALVVLTGLLFGLAPAMRIRAMGLQAGLREGSRGSTGVASRRINSTLVAAQLALSLVLLVGAGLLLKSFSRLLAVDPGFQPQNVLTLRVFIPNQKYPQPAQSAQFYRALVDRVRSLSGVRAAGLISNMPFTGDIEADGTIVEGHEPAPGVPVSMTRIAWVSPGFYQALGIPLLRGRDFQDSDRGGSLPVAVVNDTLAHKFWPDGDAIGKRIRFAWDNSPEAWLTIVGVAASIKDNTLDDPHAPFLYIPHAQAPSRRMNLVVRTVSDPMAAVTAIRGQLREMDPDVPMFFIQTMEEHIQQTLQGRRMTNLLLAAFAGTALLLAAVGIYGVMSLEVNGRVREFGIRMALGAQTGDVFRTVLAHALRITAAGTLAGLAAAVVATRFLTSLLFEVQATDPATYLTVSAVLVLAALVACWVPARRATRVDPIVALRYE